MKIVDLQYIRNINKITRVSKLSFIYCDDDNNLRIKTIKGEPLIPTEMLLLKLKTIRTKEYTHSQDAMNELVELLKIGIIGATAILWHKEPRVNLKYSMYIGFARFYILSPEVFELKIKK